MKQGDQRLGKPVCKWPQPGAEPGTEDESLMHRSAVTCAAQMIKPTALLSTKGGGFPWNAVLSSGVGSGVSWQIARHANGAIDRDVAAQGPIPDSRYQLHFDHTFSMVRVELAPLR